MVGYAIGNKIATCIGAVITNDCHRAITHVEAYQHQHHLDHVYCQNGQPLVGITAFVLNSRIRIGWCLSTTTLVTICRQ